MTHRPIAYTRQVVACLACVLILAACDNSPSLSVEPLDNPLSAGAQLPNVSTHRQGAVISWVERALEESKSADQNTATPPMPHTFRFSYVSRDGKWQTPRDIASGSDWFINWADFPGVYAGPDDQLFAHWLQRSGKSTYAYDVVFSQRVDGQDWSTPTIAHRDGTQTEHGFVSYFTSGDQTSMVWLDGRNTAASANGHAAHNHAGDSDNGHYAMSLRTRRLSGNDKALSGSTLLDARVCDCCQTAAASTTSGAVVFYRDRSQAEIRDIAYVYHDRQTGAWSDPQTLHADDWNISGCPVNGPQADANGNRVAVAWFTAMPSPRVLVAVSTDGGRSFEEPVIVSQHLSLGRVDVVMLPDDRFLVSYLESGAASQPGEDSTIHAESASIKLTLFDTALTAVATVTAATLDAGRRSGFPRMAALDDDAALLAWTVWENNVPSVVTARVTVR